MKKFIGLLVGCMTLVIAGPGQDYDHSFLSVCFPKLAPEAHVKIMEKIINALNKHEGDQGGGVFQVTLFHSTSERPDKIQPSSRYKQPQDQVSKKETAKLTQS